MPSESEHREQARFDQNQDAKREYDNLRARFESACDLLARMQAHLDRTGLAKLGESYPDTVLPRLIAKYDELRADNEGLKQDRDDADRDVETLQAVVKRQDAKVERLETALRQILQDPNASILDSHCDDGWTALSQ